ncbi:MAG: PTS sugar transporter subunit IIA [Spirochaetes bacterium]|nr:PTS sugar transporter subunit IIA [Spirochaetota bacterium]
MDLEGFFDRKQIIKLKSKEKQLVIKELVDKLQDLDLITNKERYYAQVIHRESLENTGIGNGFAIPHARTESVSDLISIFGILEKPIDYQSIDDKPVKYLLLSIFPTEMSTRYLYLIGMMARLFAQKDKKKSLDAEPTPAKVYAFLKKEYKAYYESISVKDRPSHGKPDNLSGVPSSDLDLLIRLDSLYKTMDDGNKSDSLVKKIESLRKLIDNRSLTYYERMRKKRDNPFSIVEKNSCSGCHMEIPPFYIEEIRERKGIPLCTHCGRFLILL